MVKTRVSQTYLRSDKTNILVQRRLGTDVIEHIFAYFRMRNPEFTMLDAARNTANLAGHAVNGVTGLIKNKSAKTNSTGPKEFLTSILTAPLRKKEKSCRK
jgi:hypothetical protein